MKKIGILSDTHSCWDDRYAVHFKDCDEIWHAGDVGDIDIIRRLEDTAPVVRAVRGNIDHGDVCRRCCESEIFEVEGLRIWLTHIAGYPGKYAPGVRDFLATNRINIMVCGHSHILKVMPDRQLGLLHINPGAAGYHGWQKVRTLIRLTVDSGNVSSLEVIELGKQ
ncbi:metallophosphoesterase family protein [uncultured Duncaniella sp.]|uniref:metallophosphoesterase family protein n=1 Tax=uncultured Duncaniella sp. TaxID=2768039 RepID=UPI0025FC257A|nr:metallophosphoesterase family protein [uncultured Duncaniella sp.]